MLDLTLRDALPTVRQQLVDAGVLTEELEARVAAAITAAVDEATDYAAAEPDPAPATATRHVYAEDV
jgi:2-oxoisovalerate dehydrogenase E1 component alpha subunit